MEICWVLLDILSANSVMVPCQKLRIWKYDRQTFSGDWHPLETPPTLLLLPQMEVIESLLNITCDKALILCVKLMSAVTSKKQKNYQSTKHVYNAAYWVQYPSLMRNHTLFTSHPHVHSHMEWAMPAFIRQPWSIIALCPVLIPVPQRIGGWVVLDGHQGLSPIRVLTGPGEE